MNLYRSESSYPKNNAQRNLCGRTHYVDDDTLRWHKSRVISAHDTCNGLLFWIITSDALDMNNTRRGFRYVIFDLYGNTLARPDLEHAFRTSDQARKAMYAELNKIDAVAVNMAATDSAERYHADEMVRTRKAIQDAGDKAKAA